MSRVHLLPDDVAEKIAAGEVVERPSSIVKELVENSLDAGATEIAVHLKDGGKDLVEVLDNGLGIHVDDLALALKRHATSKIQKFEDLEKLHTLGFRGEALPSIAAVSNLSLLSRPQEGGEAFELTPGALQPQPVTFGHFLGTAHGTRIQAQGLFSQIPARLKFLKSARSEVAAVKDWIEKLALTRADVGFKLVQDDRTVLDLRPQELSARLKILLADGQDLPVVTRQTENPLGEHSITVRAYWLQGWSGSQSRKIIQIVNGRVLRDRLIQQALLTAFRQALLPGQYPAVLLEIEMDPAAIDVNVHPTKTEVRFLDSRSVFSAVEYTLAGMISNHGAPVFAGGSSDFSSHHSRSAQPFQSPKPWDRTPRFSASENFSFEKNPPPTNSGFSLTPTQDSPPQTTAPLFKPENPLSHTAYRGTLFKTYLIFESQTDSDELILVDQHAADERIRYEALKIKALKTDTPPESQDLLLPEPVKLSTDHSEHLAELESLLPKLAGFGFSAEFFSEDTLLFRSIPAFWGTRNLAPRLKSLIDRLVEAPHSPSQNADRPAHFDERVFEALASEACHSAVRAGDTLLESEAWALIDSLFEMEHPWNCPHGRPTIVRVPRARLEEWFLRTV